MMTMMIHIMLCDIHAIVKQGLRLSSFGYIRTIAPQSIGRPALIMPLPPRSNACIMGYRMPRGHRQPPEEPAMPPPVILNDFTAAEIQAARARLGSPRTDRPCLWCEKVKSMRADQHFCSTACRAAYARAAAQLAHERLVREKEAWLIEREGLIQEIAELRHRLGD